MIIDLILDRKDGHEYKAKEFYDDVMAYEEGTDYKISRALDGGTEKDVKRELCDYIIRNNYNPKICNYINRVTWLEDEATAKELNNSLDWINRYNDFYGDEKIQNTIVSNGYVREQMISTLEEFIKAVQDTVDEYKQLDKELKL
jgi:SOS response regulatory protein OraA/RecX